MTLVPRPYEPMSRYGAAYLQGMTNTSPRKILSPGGGFVFNTVHNILPEVPPANVMAMFEALDEFAG